MEGLSQANSVPTNSNYAVMVQLSQMTAAMNAMQAQLNTLSAEKKTITKIKYDCRSCGSNLSHGMKACTSKKSVHKDKAYRNKILGGSEEGC